MSLLAQMRNLLLCALGMVLLPHASADTVSPLPPRNFTSPESTLESYWALKDWSSTNHRSEQYRKAKEIHAVFLKKMAEVTTGETQRHFLNWEPLSPIQISRKIKSKVEDSSTRVTIIANVKNATPIPAKAAPSASQLFMREAGQDYKYVLEKSDMEWKILEVWRVGPPGIPSNAYRLYVDSPTLSFPSYVFDD